MGNKARDLQSPKSKWRLDALLGIAIGFFAGAVYIFAVVPARENKLRASCQSNLKQMGLAFKQYITDWDEDYPHTFFDADRSRRFDSARDIGWAQALDPYLKAPRAFQCPAEPNSQNLTGGITPGYSDYFYNTNLSGTTEAKINFSEKTILLGDYRSEHAGAAAASTVGLDETAAQRHLGGANYAFVDGHVKWILPDKISDSSPSRAEYSFLFK